RRVCGRLAGAALEQRPAERKIARTDEQEPKGRRAVTSRPAHFLVVGFDRSGRTQMDHGADVRTVDPHAERVGRHHDLEPAIGELSLHDVAGLAVEPGVIRAGPPAARREPRALLVGLLARGRVDDRGATRAPGAAERFGERAVDEALALATAADLRGAQGQVGPREAAYDLRRIRGQAEA